MGKPTLMDKTRRAAACARRPLSRRMPRAGFTVIELMVVLVLIAVVAALALPSFSSLVDSWRVRRAIAEMQNVMRLANAQAIRTRSHVVIAAKSAGCRSLTNTQNWSCGLTVFQDLNRNNVQDPDEPTLRDIPEFAMLAVMHTGGNNAFLTYGPYGAPIANPSRFEFYPDGAPNSTATQTICLSMGGKMRVKTGMGC